MGLSKIKKIGNNNTWITDNQKKNVNGRLELILGKNHKAAGYMGGYKEQPINRNYNKIIDIGKTFYHQDIDHYTFIGERRGALRIIDLIVYVQEMK